MGRVAIKGRLGRDLPAAALFTLLGFFFRTWQLPSIPSGLLWDEGAEGLEAARLFHGQFPIFFPEHSGHEPLLIYAQAGALKLLGWSPFALRVPTAFLGTLAVPAIFIATRRLFGWRVAWIATLLASTSLWQVAPSRLGTRPETLAVFSALTLYWTARWIQGDQRWWPALACGLCAGAATYTYTSARFLAVALGAAWCLTMLISPAKRRTRAHQGLLAGVTALVVFAPLGAYFLTHPGTFFERADGLSIFSPQNGGALGAGLQSLAKTAAMFTFAGEPGWDKNIAGQPIFNPVLSVLFMAGLGILLWRIRRPAFGLALIWLLALLAPLVLTARDVPDFGRISGTAPVVFALPALAVAWLWTRFPRLGWVLACAAFANVGWDYHDYFGTWQGSPARQEVYRPGVLAAGQQALDTLLGAHPPATLYFGTLQPYDAVTDFLLAGFQIEHPAQSRRVAPYDARYTQVQPSGGSSAYVITTGLPETSQLPAPPTTVGWSLGGALLIDGYSLPAMVAPGQTITVQAWWRPGIAPAGDVTLFAHVLDFTQRTNVAGLDESGFPTASWRGGEQVLSSFPVAIPSQTAAGAYWVELGAYTGSGQRLKLPDGQDRQLIGPLIVTPPTPPAAEPLASLTDGLDLLSSALQASPGRLNVDLRWLPNKPLAQDYTVFVHVLDASGRLVAQADGQPDSGLWPSRYWLPGVPVPDSHALTLPGSLPGGQYRVDAGLYDPRTGQRLATSRPGAEPDSVLVGTFALPS